MKTKDKKQSTNTQAKSAKVNYLELLNKGVNFSFAEIEKQQMEEEQQLLEVKAQKRKKRTKTEKKLSLSNRVLLDICNAPIDKGVTFAKLWELNTKRPKDQQIGLQTIKMAWNKESAIQRGQLALTKPYLVDSEYSRLNRKEDKTEEDLKRMEEIKASKPTKAHVYFKVIPTKLDGSNNNRIYIFNDVCHVELVKYLLNNGAKLEDFKGQAHEIAKVYLETLSNENE